MMSTDAPTFTHLNERGEARMVDISDKPTTVRTALASCTVRCTPAVELDMNTLTTAQVMGTIGAGRTADLIPLCHPIPIGNVEIEITSSDEGFIVTALVASTGQTGVEMEALMGVTIAALNVAAAVRSGDSDYCIEDVLLLRKSGGKSGEWGHAVR